MQLCFMKKGGVVSHKLYVFLELLHDGVCVTEYGAVPTTPRIYMQRTKTVCTSIACLVGAQFPDANQASLTNEQNTLEADQG